MTLPTRTQVTAKLQGHVVGPVFLERDGNSKDWRVVRMDLSFLTDPYWRSEWMPYREANRLYRRIKIGKVLVHYGVDNVALVDEAEAHERNTIDAVLWALEQSQ